MAACGTARGRVLLPLRKGFPPQPQVGCCLELGLCRWEKAGVGCMMFSLPTNRLIAGMVTHCIYHLGWSSGEPGLEPTSACWGASSCTPAGGSEDVCHAAVWLACLRRFARATYHLLARSKANRPFDPGFPCPGVL